jgi:hypothetical protein
MQRVSAVTPLADSASLLLAACSDEPTRAMRERAPLTTAARVTAAQPFRVALWDLGTPAGFT